MARDPRLPKAAATRYDGPERRRAVRRGITLMVRELRPNQASRRVVSMSTCGMYIRTTVPYRDGTLAVFEIELGRASPVIAPAWVVRCDHQDGMAFEFMAPQFEFSDYLNS